MAIIDADRYQTITGLTFSASDLQGIRAICSSVSDAITQYLKPFQAEPVTITNCILDAPPTRDLVLPVRPVRSITSVYYRSDANGLVSNFTSDYLLDNSTGLAYQLMIDDPILGISRRGVLRRINNVWGWENMALPSRLAFSLAPERGSIMVTYTAGMPVLPPSVEDAAALMVSMLWNRRTQGMPAQSESWNGESVGYAGAFTATAALHSPDIAGMLSQFAPGLRMA